MRRDPANGALRSLRERNRLLVIDVLRRLGTASRADIARSTGLSRSTVSSLVSELVRGGLVVEGEAGAPAGERGGRPGVTLWLDPAAGTALGVDFGHTHLRVVLADLSSRVLAERSVRLDVDHAAPEALDAAADLADGVLAEAGVERDGVLGVGMGLPGPIDQATGVVGSSVILPGWAGLRPAAELERRLGLQVTVDNDANLGALGELAFGAAEGTRDMLYVKVASGIGMGIVLGGRLHRGASGIAGEVGHVLVDPDGPVCRCGNRGCLETKAGTAPLLDLLRVSHGPGLTVERLLELAAAGDLGCRRVIGDAGRAIGRALADLCNTLNPERVVVGGQLSAAGDPLLQGIRQTLDRYALPGAARAVSIVRGRLGDRAGVLGALTLVIGDTERLSSAHLAVGA